MSVIVPAVCTDITGTNRRDTTGWSAEPCPLASFREAPAYVLLGDPGSGKTTAFREEAKLQGAQFVTARDFVAFDLGNHPEWRDETLFIDGLDEVRAQQGSYVVPFDKVRRRLDVLRPTRFRISCRSSDWLGGSDWKHLNQVATNGVVRVLRLEPLSRQSIVRVLASRRDVGDVRQFLDRAQELGLDGMLSNPQMLDFMVRSGAQDWQDGNRAEIFLRVCRDSVVERNIEHEQMALLGRSTLFVDETVELAGHLLAFQLLSGAAGFSLRRSQASDPYPSPEIAGAASPEKVTAVLKTKLFRSASGTTRDTRVPVHQSVGEFLAARHLARAIKQGLPVKRLLALLMGCATRVPTVHRSLAGWLASFIPAVRDILIQRDPVTLLHGSLDGFTHDQKVELLASLEQERDAIVLQREVETICYAATAALATEDMEGHLEDILCREGRSETDQTLVYLVLRVLSQASRRHRWRRVFSRVLRDESLWPISRVLALRGVAGSLLEAGETLALDTLLDDVRNGQITDEDGFLLDALLAMLYPEDLGPARIWDCLPENRDGAAQVPEFWTLHFPRHTREQDLPALLDGLHGRSEDLYRRLEHWTLGDVVLRLVARGIEAHGDQVSIKCLYNWLSAGSAVLDSAYVVGRDSASRRVRAWLEPRDSVYKALVLEGLARPADWNDAYFHFGVHVEKALFDARVPKDFGLWCLGQVDRAEVSGRQAEILFQWAVRAAKNKEGAEGLTLEALLGMARGREPFREILERLMPLVSSPAEASDASSKATTTRPQLVQERVEAVRSSCSELHQNRASPGLLYDLARSYFGGSWEVEDSSSRNRLSKFFRGEDNLFEAALAGLRGVPARADLPTADEIIRLAAEEDRIYLLSLPLMAGMAERARDGSPSRLATNDAIGRSALASYFHIAYQSEPPAWYHGLLQERPATVAGVLLQYCRAMFRYRRVPSAETVGLLSLRGHGDVARQICLLVLRGFPLRCNREHIAILDRLLGVALRLADSAEFSQLVTKKLSRRSMTVAQRGRWLIAGLIADPRAFGEQLSSYVGKRADRTAGLAEFWRYEGSTGLQRSSQRARLASGLIRLFGRWSGPETSTEFGWVGPEAMAADAVLLLLRDLRTSSDPESGAVLRELVDHPELGLWQATINKISSERLALRIDRQHRPPKPEKLRDALRDGPPANAPDLMALVGDRIDQVGRQLRSRNTDSYRKFWNEDQNRRLTSPKHEETCRDAFLEELNVLLPKGFETEPEATYFDRKRAGIRVSSGCLQVPVEMKKHVRMSAPRHARSLRDQLVGQYANRSTNEETAGYGFYVILWFGLEGDRQDPRALRCEVLKEALKLLSPDELEKIHVHVLDVSDPRAE